jgi:hypothetical protein
MAGCPSAVDQCRSERGGNRTVPRPAFAVPPRHQMTLKMFRRMITEMGTPISQRIRDLMGRSFCFATR